MLIKKATIIDKNSTWHLKSADVLIQKGQIVKIAKSIKNEGKDVIEGSHIHISPSWIDIGPKLNDPGYEYRESLHQLLNAAEIGGFGRIAPTPSKEVPVSNKATVDFLSRSAKIHNIDLIPIGSLSLQNEGKDIGELVDLHHEGCRLFSDGRTLNDYTNLATLGAMYIKSFGGKLLLFPFDPALNDGGTIHEGKVSTILGMKGIPSYAEIASVHKILLLAESLDLSIVLFGLSCNQSLELVKSHNKKSKSHIPTVVPYLNLIFNDEDLLDFDTNLKVAPPIRSVNDQKKLQQGINKREITAISSFHTPLSPEEKELEFAYAKYGASGIESLYSAITTYAKSVKTEALIDALTYGPAEIINTTINPIEEGTKADITIFDPTVEYIFNVSGPSINNPFHGKKLKGKVLKVIR